MSTKPNAYADCKTWGWQYFRLEKMTLANAVEMPDGSFVRGIYHNLYTFKFIIFKISFWKVGF